ncbi:MAG: FtsX-like permease family protein [Rhodothermales bacterium]|nr:FtsX-like permease family protein [Rhodothermales bacterium]
MTGHYLRQAARLLAKQRLHALINVVGLATALGLCILIAVFVKQEHSFDTWHQNADRTYRVDRIDFNPDGSFSSQQSSQPYNLAESLLRDHPDVEAAVRFNQSEVVIRAGGVMHQQNVLFADPSVLQVFTYVPVQGALEGAFSDLAGVVLTETAADRILGPGNVVGRELEVRFGDTYLPAVVTAVIEDLPAGTSLPFEVLMNFERAPLVYPWIARRIDNWRGSSFETYVLLREGTDMQAATQTLERLRTQYYPTLAEEGRQAGWWTGEGEPATYGFVSLTDLHLQPNAPGQFVTPTDPKYSLILLGIGLLILALAAINFTLLTLGRSSIRAGEIGVRKALGAGRRDILVQFGGESILTALLGFVGAIALASILMPAAISLTGREMSLADNLDVLLAVGVIAILTGILSGAYPSVVISRNRPSDTLRGRLRLTGSNTLSRALLLTQFAASIALVAGALVMQAQIGYLLSQEKGYDDSNVLVVETNGTDGFELTSHLRNSLGSNGAVEGISAMSLSFNRGYSSSSWMAAGVEKRAYIYNVDTELPDFLRMELLAGRSFEAGRSSDSTEAVVVNQAFARDWGWTAEEAVGQRITDYDNEPVIIGVVADMNFRSLHEEVQPMMLTLNEGWLAFALIRAAPGRTRDAVAALEDAWQSFESGAPLRYTFLNEDVAQAYEQDLRWARIMGIAALLAILVACMGLFGLAAMTVARRTKEIGVRKVLGATVGGVTLLVSRDFAVLVGIASLVGVPLAYLGLNRWLEGFAYRMDLGLSWFLGSCLLVLLIAMATVSIHAFRAATTDPVRALRYE